MHYVILFFFITISHLEAQDESYEVIAKGKHNEIFYKSEIPREDLDSLQSLANPLLVSPEVKSDLYTDDILEGYAYKSKNLENNDLIDKIRKSLFLKMKEVEVAKKILNKATCTSKYLEPMQAASFTLDIAKILILNYYFNDHKKNKSKPLKESTREKILSDLLTLTKRTEDCPKSKSSLFALARLYDMLARIHENFGIKDKNFRVKLVKKYSNAFHKYIIYEFWLVRNVINSSFPKNDLAKKFPDLLIFPAMKVIFDLKLKAGREFAAAALNNQFSWQYKLKKDTSILCRNISENKPIEEKDKQKFFEELSHTVDEKRYVLLRQEFEKSLYKLLAPDYCDREVLLLDYQDDNVGLVTAPLKQIMGD